MTIGIIIIYLSTITGLAVFTKIRPVIFRLLVILLLITSINESLMLLSPNIYSNRTLVYNIFSLIEIITWGILIYFMHLHLQSKKIISHKNVHAITLLLLLAGSITEIILRQNIFHTYSYRLFSTYVILNCLYYYSYLVKIGKQFSIWKDGFFWIFTGALIFQVVFAFYLTAIEYPEFTSAPDAFEMFNIVLAIINGAYYIMLARGLICLSYYRP